MGRPKKGRSATPSLDVIKASYRNARDNGDKEEEARWANQIGHAFKDRGEYVTALKWFRLDYEISSSGSGRLDPAKLMPTCQSIGEVYLRLQNYEDALTYQQKHFHWAEQACDLIEQQRASTQLGRTYLELYETKERLSAMPDAKAYFQISLDLARSLRANPPTNHTSPSGFVVEQVDAYNNLGLARALSEDFKHALKFYTAGLKLCDEEEVDDNDAARSRIHHNLGRLYAELRDWEKAKYHTELDIEICQNIPHAQGEAKGLMNMADLYFKSQDYEQASRCYKRALHIAQTLEDEDALISQIKGNIEVVGQARAQMKAFDADMQKLSKLRREVESSKGTAAERKYIKQECVLLLELTSRAEDLQAWEVHLGLAKRLKRLTKGLGDIEKLGDALEIVASSYYSLRNPQKAMKWHSKSFEVCKRIGHLEGQIVSKINYGNALDSSGDSVAALTAYQEALEAAKTVGGIKMLPQQISALDNIHYCYFVRLERLDDARKVELELKQLKCKRDAADAEDDHDRDERCSETGSEGHIDDSSLGAPSIFDSDDNVDILDGRERVSNLQSQKLNFVLDSDESDDDNAPLSSIKPQIRSRRILERKRNTVQTKQRKRVPAAQTAPVKQPHVDEKGNTQRKRFSGARTESTCRDRKKPMLSVDEELGGSLEAELGRRQGRNSARGIPLFAEDNDSAVHFGYTGSERKLRCPSRSDPVEHVDLCSDDEMSIFSRKKHKLSIDLCTDDEMLTFSRKKHKLSIDLCSDDGTPTSSRRKRKISNSCSKLSSCTDNLASPVDNIEEVPTGGETWLHKFDNDSDLPDRNSSELGSKYSEGCRGEMSPLRARTPIPSRRKSGEAVAQTQISGPQGEENLGLGTTRLSSISADQGAQLEHAPLNDREQDREGRKTFSNTVPGWKNTSLLERYLNHCSDGAEFIPVNSLLVEKLRYQKVAEEVVVASCNMQDRDARHLLTALAESDAFSLLDMSHNLLGNSTVNAIQELIKSTNQADLGLTLDLHCNKLGAGALLEICRCPVSLSRLEVLNLSANRLTDAASRHLSKILKESQALATLNLESCGLTTRAVTQLTSALHSQSPLNKLCIGNNWPIASHAIQELLHQLSTLAWFSYLDLKCIELDATAVAALCTFVEKSKRITSLILQKTSIRNDGALAIAVALSKSSHCLQTLDLSLNCFNEDPAAKLCDRVMSLKSLLNLNLSGNDLGEKAAELLAQGLSRPDSRLKVLDISKCHLGESSLLLIMQSLTRKITLLYLNLAENIVPLEMQLSPADDLLLPDPAVEVNYGEDGENPSLKVSTDENCWLLERELAAADAHHAEAPIAGVVQGGQQSEETGRDLRSYESKPSSIQFKNEGPKALSGTDTNGREGLVDNLDQSLKCEAGSGLLQAEAACPEWHGSEADVRVGKMNSETDGGSESIPPVVQFHTQEVKCNSSGTEPGPSSAAAHVGLATTSATTSTTSHAFCNQLAASIRNATGLQWLDLSNNAIDKIMIDILYLAWSACPRGGSSDHDRHVDGNVLQFGVKGRPCPGADPPCCSSAEPGPSL